MTKRQKCLVIHIFRKGNIISGPDLREGPANILAQNSLCCWVDKGSHAVSRLLAMLAKKNRIQLLCLKYTNIFFSWLILEYFLKIVKQNKCNA